MNPMSVFWMMAPLMACASPDDGPAGDAYDGQLYAVQHNVNTPEGRTVYVNVLPSLDAPGEAVDLSNAIELNGYSAVRAHNGALFIAEEETRRITRWSFDEAGQAQPDAEMSLANEALDTFWNEDFLFIDETTAWYANGGNREILIWDPLEMVITGRIPLTGLDFTDLPVTFHGLGRSGDRVFMPLSFVDWYALDAHLEVVVAEFSLSAQQLIAIHRDDRCAISMSVQPALAMGADGTLYVLGDAGFGTFNHADLDVSPASCVLRIRPSDTGFDPNWSVVLDGAIEGYGDASTLLIDPEAGLAFTDLMKQPDTPFETIDELWDWQYTPGHTRRAACDLDTYTDCAFVDEAIEGTLHWFSTRLDARVLMTSLLTANNENSDFGDCVIYDMTEAGPKALFQTTGFISNLVRVR